jgi:hypothetical protein
MGKTVFNEKLYKPKYVSQKEELEFQEFMKHSAQESKNKLLAKLYKNFMQTEIDNTIVQTSAIVNNKEPVTGCM